MTLSELNLSSDNILWDLCFSRYQLATLTVADELGLFEKINNNSITIDELSSVLEISSRAVEVLIRLLSGFKLININKNYLSLTATAKDYLLPTSYFYWGKMLSGLRAKEEHKILMTAIKKTQHQLKHNGQSFTEMWQEGTITAEAARDFTDKMHATIFGPAITAVNSGIFENINHLVDMGGGAGSFDIALISKYPDKKATMFDLPQVCDVAREYIRQFKLSEKIKIYPGNFFKDSWPKDCDGMLFSNVFHDWPKSICYELARKAYEALTPDGTIFVHEMLLDDNNDSPLISVNFDQLMFINHQSQQFVRDELFDLLTEIGFKSPQVINTFGYFSMVSAKKI